MYDTTPHKDTGADASARIMLSNCGLAVYEEFTEAVVLSKAHCLQALDGADTPDKIAYNDAGNLARSCCACAT